MPSLPAEVTRDQQHRYITYTETDYTPDIDQAYPGARLPVARSLRVQKLRDHRHRAGCRLVPVRRDQEPRSPAPPPIDYEVVADGVTPQKRLLSHGRTLFLDNALNPLPLGQWDSLGLGHQSYRLAFTPGVTAAHYAGKVTRCRVHRGRLRAFRRRRQLVDSVRHGHLPGESRRRISTSRSAPGIRLGVETIATFDQYDLLVERVEVKQAAWNDVTRSQRLPRARPGAD